MPHYDYLCSKCEHEQEEFHMMSERPLVHCDKCRGACIKLISAGEGGFIGMKGGHDTYDFVDYNTTGKPVKINNKRQWKEHLKLHGLNDDVPNDTKNLKFTKTTVDKEKMKRETKAAIVSAVKDKKHIKETKLKVQKQMYDARNK